MIRSFLIFALFFAPINAIAADWPMWRADSGRTALSPDALPEDLSVKWVRQLPPLEPAYRHPRLGFDGGYEPVIAAGRLFLASSLNDSVTAYNASTGELIWRFYTGGPVRFAPVAHDGKLYFGSDDGHVYCLNANDGTENWRFQAVPSPRTVLGNRRVISVWPIRGGPVVADGTLYFAAGVWPFEGVFVYALDPETGDVKWLNDQTGYIYGVQPHDARSIGGLTPQGYLLVSGDELVVPCSAAPPARFNRLTGELIHFEPPRAGREPGGWFASFRNVDLATARAVRRGEITFDSAISADQHEDKIVRGEGEQGIRSQITTRDRVLDFASPPAGIEGTVYAMAAAQEMLFVSTVQGRLYALGKSGGARGEEGVDVTPLTQNRVITRPPDAATHVKAKSLLDQTEIKSGYALVLGATDGQLIEALVAQSPMHFLVIESDLKIVAELRRRWDRAGIYGSRVVIRHQSPTSFTPPRYFANLILCEDSATAGFQGKQESLSDKLDALRPFGGIAFLGGKIDLKAPAGASVREGDVTNEWTTIVRSGALPGTTNYAGDWKQSTDKLVGAPLGVLWFDDAVGHFKRSPQPLFTDGVMVSQPKDWSDLSKRPYPLMAPSFTDVYTGRPIDSDESMVNGKAFRLHDKNKNQPPVYRPAHLETGKLAALRPDLGEMINPLNGHTEERVFPKSYGCDGGVDYGDIISMRSGTAAFYDKRLESGTIHISGPRSGCTNSIIPANGLLNLPYFYEGCTCSYPLPVGLAMIKLPETHEQWATYGELSTEDVGRLGLNFGAPGDRMTDSGTLWLDAPNVGGPSPPVRATVEPATASPYYHHALWIRGGHGWPWVAASGIRGIRSLKIEGLRPGKFTVRLIFAETEKVLPGERKFSVLIQHKLSLKDFDPVIAAGGVFRSYVHETQDVSVAKDGLLHLHFEAKVGETILSGVELGTKTLPLGSLPSLQDRKTNGLHTASQQE